MSNNQTKFKETEIGLIPTDWSVATVGDFCDLMISGGTPSRMRRDYFLEGTIPWIKTKELRDFYIYDTEERITEKAIKNSSAKILPKNTISMAMYGATVGKLGIFGIDASTNQACCNMVVNKNSDFKFLFYTLLYKRQSIVERTSGAAQQNLNVSTIKSFAIAKPPLQEQTQIAEILSSLDDKIELNRKMNETLEKIGQTLFKHWFVDFEFPDENGKPYKSSGGKMIDSELGQIPEGWKVGFLGDNELAKIIGSGIKQFDDQKTYIATADVDKNDIVNYDTQIDWNTKPSRANAQPETFSIWFAKMKNTNKKLIFTDLNIWEINNLILSTGFLGLKSKENAVFYLWNFINNNDFEMNKDLLCKGCTMEAINNDNVKNIDVILPSDINLDEFNIIYKSIYEQIYNNKKENRNLSKIRDLLLPRLMSGKLRVK